MRQIGLGDLHHAARVIQAMPEDARVQTCAELLWQAHVADKYVKRMRKLHPKWGNGSLRAAALAWPLAPQRPPPSAELHRCLLLVLCAVIQRRAANGRGCSCERVCSSLNCAK